MNRLFEKYKNEAKPLLMKKFSLKNVMQVPRFNKIVINMGVGIASQDPKYLELALKDLELIAGQRPVATLAKKAEASFKIREGMKIGAKVTLRDQRMYAFFDKLVNVAIPRIRDFRGLNPNSFDQQGNYSMGLKEQVIFPEINPDAVKHFQGMDITIGIHCHAVEHARELLKIMGVPLKDK
ncbi:50S ribosomal protein L5 [PVC group bacterium (ex Bugula neritina AB1)]|nr:50S ribosomal protein L5 [PVC group bacterium (ex Bugula neritina AB1)]